MRISSLVLLALALSACSTVPVGPVAPHPTINLARTSQRLALALSPSVPSDVFDVDCGKATGQVCTLHVTGFHTSLTNGFTAGFQPYYTIAPQDADLTLRLESLSIEFDVRQHLILRFAAQLDDRSGKTLGRSFGTLPPTRRIGEIGAEAALGESLTLMFEKVAADCFAPLSITR